MGTWIYSKLQILCSTFMRLSVVRRLRDLTIFVSVLGHRITNPARALPYSYATMPDGSGKMICRNRMDLNNEETIKQERECLVAFILVEDSHVMTPVVTVDNDDAQTKKYQHILSGNWVTCEGDRAYAFIDMVLAGDDDERGPLHVSAGIYGRDEVGCLNFTTMKSKYAPSAKKQVTSIGKPFYFCASKFCSRSQ